MITEHKAKGDLTMTTEMSTNTFAQRFNQACDDSVIIPPYGKGRQVAIAKRLNVTQEAVRKWFAGESIPRPMTVRALAEYLQVDEPWLVLGIKPEFDRSEKRRNLIVYNGAVHLVAGLIILEGGSVAFPVDSDGRAGHVDIYAIMHSQQIAIHVCLARELSNGHYEVKVPREYDDVQCIAVVKTGNGKFVFLNMPSVMIKEHKARKAGDFIIIIEKHASKFMSNSNVWPQFKTFGELV